MNAPLIIDISNSGLNSNKATLSAESRLVSLFGCDDRISPAEDRGNRDKRRWPGGEEGHEHTTKTPARSAQPQIYCCTSNMTAAFARREFHGVFSAMRRESVNSLANAGIKGIAADPSTVSLQDHCVHVCLLFQLPGSTRVGGIHQKGEWTCNVP